MENCIFCKIAKNEIESKVIYEDDTCMALLDINPVSEGHSIIIPKNHYESVSDVDEKILKKLILVAKEVGEKSKTLLGATGYNILNATGKDAQQSVFHLHFHVVPRYKNDNLDLWFHGKGAERVDIVKTFEKYKTSTSHNSR